jgi:hypothetical protein
MVVHMDLQEGANAVPGGGLGYDHLGADAFKVTHNVI